MCRLGDVVDVAVQRARRHAPDLAITERTTNPAVIRGERSLLERPSANLLDNAASGARPAGRSR